MFVFGPVPSRRLGFSLGINHIPPKYCPYSCVYCQVGRTTSLSIKRKAFFSVDEILAQVENRIAECSHNNIKIDYLSLVPDGEPALDLNLRSLVSGLKRFEFPLAVITNSSLLTSEDVQAALLQADWVSLKVDSVLYDEWKLINRPHRQLNLPSILSAICDFSKKYDGTLVTETMLVSGVNDNKTSINHLSSFLGELRPHRCYLSIPIRPPAEKWVKPPLAEKLSEIIGTLQQKYHFFLPLFENEAQGFLSTGDLRNNILEITAVHPIRESALRKMVFQSGNNWEIVEKMLEEGIIILVQYAGEKFLRKNLDN